MVQAKQTLGKLLQHTNEIWYRGNLPNSTGDYFIKPLPIYINQFLSLQSENLKSSHLIDNPVLIKEFGAKNSEEFTFWAWRSCGIACVKMILGEYSPKFMQLINEGKSLGGYVTHDENGKFIDRGWYHSALAELLIQHGHCAQIKKWQSLESVAFSITRNNKIIASVTTYTGHLILLTGVKLEIGKVMGIYAHDPGLGRYKENIFIPEKDFRKIFTGRTICCN